MPSIRGLVTRVAGASLASLARDPQVKYISPDREIRSSSNYAQFTIGAITLQKLGFTGKGAGVAVIDSGAYNNQAGLLDSVCTPGTYRRIYAENFVADDEGTGDPWGHGTAVAGLIAGNGRCRAQKKGSVPAATIDNNPDLRLSGIAPEASILALRALDSSGKGVGSTVISAIDKAIGLKQNRPDWNLRVINLSLGRPVRESYQKGSALSGR